MSQLPSSRRAPLTLVQKRVLTLFSVIVTATFGLLVVSLVQRTRASASQVVRARRILLATDTILVRLIDAETGQRGQFATGSDRFLEPYNGAQRDVRAAIGSVRALIAGDPVQLGRLHAVDSTASQLFILWQRLIDARRQGLTDFLVLLPALGEGKRMMDSVRERVAAMRATEEGALAARVAEDEERAQISLALTVSGAVVIILLSVVLNRALARDAELQSQATAIVSQQNAQLQHQTEELQRQSGELQRRGERMERQAAELARNVQALGRSNRELDQFAYVASHDLKAPLRGIANLAQWIQDDIGETIPDAVRKHIALLHGRIKRMELLIDGILAYSRAGRLQSTPESVDVKQMVRETVDLLAPPPTTSVIVEPGLPVLVTERTPLSQTFMNLISNAFKHARHDRAEVRIGGALSNGVWTFFVADNGPGIAPKYHERIFGIFQTLESRDKVEGTGIGLSVVKKLVEAHHGTITVESDEGKGATFRFTWPLESTEAPFLLSTQTT